MLSDRIIHWVKLRMAIIKYFGNAAFSWDLKSDKMLLTHNYVFWTWCGSYCSGYPLVLLLIAMLYNYTLEENERLASDPSAKVDPMKNLSMTSAIITCSLLFFCQIIVSILKSSRNAVCAIYYACVHLDQTIKESFRKIRTNLQPIRNHARKYEQAILLTIFVSTFIPFCFLFTPFFLPIDLGRAVLVQVFEISLRPTLPLLLFSLFYSWSTLAVANTFITFIFPVIFTTASCHIWTSVTLPISSTRSSSEFQTSTLGVLHTNHILQIYRYNQLLCNYLNAIIAKFQIALHFGIIHVIFIGASYVLIRNGQMMLSVGAYDLIIICLLVVLLITTFVKFECYFIGTTVATSKEMKTRFLSLASRKSYAYKVAKSFQTLVIQTTYPLFTMSNETYLEFVNVSVDHIVNLLCL